MNHSNQTYWRSFPFIPFLSHWYWIISQSKTSTRLKSSAGGESDTLLQLSLRWRPWQIEILLKDIQRPVSGHVFNFQPCVFINHLVSIYRCSDIKWGKLCRYVCVTTVLLSQFVMYFSDVRHYSCKTGLIAMTETSSSLVSNCSWFRTQLRKINRLYSESGHRL